jgi:hypothetical protein
MKNNSVYTDLKDQPIEVWNGGDTDLISLHEWNSFAEKRMTLLEALTLLNNRYRSNVAALEDELEKFRDAAKMAHDVLLTVVNECNVFYKESADIDNYTLDDCYAAISKIKQLKY